MRKKLGIFQLELPDITLTSPFNDGSRSEITSLLNEEQKEIIKTLGGSKLVLLNVYIEDSGAESFLVKNGFCSISLHGLSITSINGSDQITFIGLQYDVGEDKYYIYS